MLSREELCEKVKQVLMDDFEVEEEAISEDASLFQDLELDSLDAIDLMVTLDKELNIEIKTEEMKDVRTMKDVCDFVLSLTTANE